MERPSFADREALLHQMDEGQYSFVRWNNVNIDYRAMHLESTIGVIPDVTDRSTVISLAKMTNNAYLDINLNNTEWYDLGAPWQLVMHYIFLC
jgi:putative lipase involved disintegration of autophagic bodies